MRLLLTAFEPFGGETLNPSAEVLRAIEAAPPSDVDLHTAVLSVRGRISFDRLLPLLDDLAPDAWIGLGEAGGRPHLSVERTGINLLVDRGDPDRAADEQTLVEGAPAAYFTRWPVAGVAQRIADAGVPAAVSNTAGTYICNEVTYAVLHHLATAPRWSAREVTAGFLHLPYLPDQAATKPARTPSVALDAQVRGVRAAIEFTRERAALDATAASAQ